MPNKGHTKIISAERDRIAQWVSQKVGIREIARRLGRAPSSISEELARNTHMEAGYVAIHAQRLTDERIAEARKRPPLKNGDVFAYVHAKLHCGWSPEMIAGKLEKEHVRRVVSHETIYQYVYAPENVDRALFEYPTWKTEEAEEETRPRCAQKPDSTSCFHTCTAGGGEYAD